MAKKIAAWAVLIVAIVLTLATSPAFNGLYGSIALEAGDVSGEEPYYAISGTIALAEIEAEAADYADLSLSISIAIEQTPGESDALTLYQLPEEWDPETGTPSDELALETFRLLDGYRDEEGIIYGTLYVPLESASQSFHLLVVIEGDYSATIGGELAANVSFPPDIELPENAEIILTLD